MTKSKVSKHRITPVSQIEPLEARIAPATIYGVDSTSKLVKFDSATPGTVLTIGSIGNLQANEVIQGLDFRPATGELYALGLVDDGTTRTGRLYKINTTTAMASQVGTTPFSTALADTDNWGFDFNPVVDRIRLVASTGSNLRLDPNTGQLAGTDTNTGLNLDAVAYDRTAGGGATTLFAYDESLDRIVTIGGFDGNPSPNTGSVTNIIGVTSGQPLIRPVNFDIEAGTNAAFINDDGSQELYSANLTTGALTPIGTIGSALQLRGIAVAIPPDLLLLGGTSGDDTVVVTATGASSGSYTINGGSAVAFSNISLFSFNGLAGNDTLTIINPTGGLFAPTGGINFDGGGQAEDKLVLSGGGGANYAETYSVGTTNPPIGVNVGSLGSGLIRFTGPNPVDIRVTGVTSIVDTVTAASLTVNATDAANSISVRNGLTVPQVQIGVDSYAPIEFNNKTAVVVNSGDGVAGGDGNDFVSVTYSNSPAGLTSLTVNGNEGADTLAAGDVDRNWSITGANAGTVGGTTFAGIETLQGGNGLDTFTLATGVTTFNGTINGGSTPPPTGVDVLVATDGANQWEVTNTNAGTLNTSTIFQGIESLTGGSADDYFLFKNGNAIAGNLNGGSGGKDTVESNGFTGGTTVVNLSAGTISNGGVGGSFSNIDVFVGSGTTVGTIVGPNTATTWTIKGADAGEISGGFEYSGYRNLTGGTADDSFVFETAGSVSGAVDGGGGTDVLDYSAFTTGVSVNLGSTVTGLSAALDGSQENPPQSTAASGTASFTYNAATKTFNVQLAVSGLLPTDVTGFHLHRAEVGTNGPVIVDLAALGVFAPDGSGGFTFNASNVALPALQEAAFFGGLTYFNIHTAAAPGGLIRGAVFSTAPTFTAATGSATATGGVSNVENVKGGSAADSIVGSAAANNLQGAGGNDTILGAQGADTLDGGANNDAIVWNNGDGTDVVDGGLGTDLVQVNGSTSAGDTFTAGANASRLTFARTNLGLFSLDIGTAETLLVNGNGGDDNTTIESLTSVTNLTAVKLNGQAGNDQFTLNAITPGVTYTITGGGQTTNDTLAVANGTNTWSITGANSGTLNTTHSFAGVESLVGGTDGDAFTLSGGTLSGSIDANSGNDTLTGDNVATNWTITGQNGGTVTGVAGGFTRVDNVVGGSAADTFTFGNSGILTGSLNGGAGENTITGDDNGNVFAITGSNTGTLTETGSSPASKMSGWSNIANLNGGSGADTFQFSGSGTLTGTVDGKAGKDTLDSAGPVTLAALGSIDGFAGTAALLTGTNGNDYDNIDAIVAGGGTGSDTFQGLDFANTFTISGGNSGVYGTGGRTLDFSGIANLVGGSSTDEFTFTNAGTLTGTINGGAGDNTLVGDDNGNEFIASATAAGTLTGKLTTFQQIQNLEGGAAGDSFEMTLWTGAGSLTGGGVGMGEFDTVKIVDDANFHISDTRLNTAKITGATQPLTTTGRGLRLPYATVFTGTGRDLDLTDITKAELTGGASVNIIDAGEFSGETVLQGKGGIDVLVAGTGNSKLYGFDALTPNGDPSITRIKTARTVDFDHYYVRDNPNGAVTAEIFATTRFPSNGIGGNTIHFLESSVGVTYTLPNVVKVDKQLNPLNYVPDTQEVRSTKVVGQEFNVRLANGFLQHVEGSNNADVLTGNNIANAIAGLGGADTLKASGIDIMFGTRGEDSFAGSLRLLQINSNPTASSLTAAFNFSVKLPLKTAKQPNGIELTAPQKRPFVSSSFFYVSPAEAIAKLRALV